MAGVAKVSFLLDTNIVSFHLKRPSGLTHRFVQYSGRLYVSSIALAELYVWAFRKAKPSSALSAIEAMLRNDVNRLDFDDDCARKFGQLRVELIQRGVGVNPVDLLIASVALVYDLTLVTQNTADFQNIPGLRLDDWLAP
jgi:tRNA(fMet)-specific endonuclease VapC